MSYFFKALGNKHPCPPRERVWETDDSDSNPSLHIPEKELPQQVTPDKYAEVFLKLKYIYKSPVTLAKMQILLQQT